jgi:hypothetical protein
VGQIRAVLLDPKLSKYKDDFLDRLLVSDMKATATTLLLIRVFSVISASIRASTKYLCLSGRF